MPHIYFELSDDDGGDYDIDSRVKDPKAPIH